MPKAAASAAARTTLIALDVQGGLTSEDESAQFNEAAYIALLFVVGPKLEFGGLKTLHGSKIRCSVSAFRKMLFGQFIRD